MTELSWARRLGWCVLTTTGVLAVLDALVWTSGGRLFQAVAAVTVVHLPPGQILLLGLTLLVLARGLRRGRLGARTDPTRLRSALRVAGLVATAGVLMDAGIALLTRYTSLDLDPGPLLSLVTGVGLLLVLILVLAPEPAPGAGSGAERTAVAALVQHPDADTLAPFALRADKAYVFSPDGQAVIGYRVLFGTAVVGGDPVGARSSTDAAIAAFIERCSRAGWRIAVLGAGEPAQRLWREHGLHGIGIGDEAVVDVARFDLATRRMRNVRQAVNRTHNAGVSTEVYAAAQLPAELRAGLAAIAAAWQAGRPERGFSMNLDDLVGCARPECLVIVAQDRLGQPVGFQRYALCGGQVLTLDSMPRVRCAPNGVNERLIVDMIEFARQQGLARVSLNFAAFRSLLQDGPRTGRDRLGYPLLRLLDPLIKVQPLYRFNAKFRPDWQPRAVLFGSFFELGWVLAAAFGMEFALPYDRTHAARRRAGGWAEHDSAVPWYGLARRRAGALFRGGH